MEYSQLIASVIEILEQRLENTHPPARRCARFHLWKDGRTIELNGRFPQHTTIQPAISAARVIIDQINDEDKSDNEDQKFRVVLGQDIWIQNKKFQVS